MPTDMQSEIIAELIKRLGVVDSFGAEVIEDNVLRVIDAEDTAGLRDDFIIVQPGQTEEVERKVPGTVRESVTLNVTAITRRRPSGSLLRTARLGIKCALPGPKAGLTTQGVQTVTFLPETPMPAGEGRRWACHVMPVQVTYVQPLK
ncbi:hypothetical protein BVH03_22930 [Pseudomonas sp. PA15(2017)]|uniref:hypothetical protein n=1 Tax=Pseudomonas sp. PA15(2017) TaxID=1932111 RepID=UPI0009606BCD|nr:hypothetical protein [Pseudomonas sp. PA15(2017)]OLU23087.1 hypothetical protein BVH03_22930 [Pseudomonas sp. PA15(2017)]